VTDYLQVSTAAPTRDAAIELARSAVAARLAAGAQILGPATSVFWHQGELGTGEEWVLLLKTTADRYPALQDHLIGQHPWGNPEVTAVPLAVGSPAYLDWVQRTVSAG
jgi:periplasmic divalent cation tolerance protein